MPMSIVVLGHGRRCDTKETFTLPSLYTFDSSDQMDHYKWMRTMKRLRGVAEPMVKGPRLLAMKAEWEW
jgi:hypothetical protein